ATARVAPVRAALGVRTVVNILGPLVNPAQPPLHLVGAFSLDVAGLMADTFRGLPIERAFVVHGAEGWDEPTPIGPFTLFDVRPGQVSRSVRSPEQYALERCRPADLAGGNAAHNARSLDRKSTRLNSSHVEISYAVFCLKKKTRTATWVAAQ